MWKNILKTTLLAGSLDITAACLQAWFMSGVTPEKVLRYIAGGAFGKTAYSGGLEMPLLGLIFHFFIAFACTACYFWVYPKWRLLGRRLWFDSLLIGLVAWIVTTQIIVPLSHIKASPIILEKALMAIGILVVCIGLPIAWGTKKYYQSL